MKKNIDIFSIKVLRKTKKHFTGSAIHKKREYRMVTAGQFGKQEYERKIIKK
jgi:hypothetical protein